MIGPQSRVPRYSNDDKNLIAEQPGRFVLFFGVLLAITLGLIVRGLIAPNKVKAHIAAAASSINKDLNVQFESASVSLSRGFLPRFAVLITNVKMESNNPCWMTPVLTADEIRLPLSFWALIGGDNPVTEVGAGKVEVSLRSEYKNCENTASTTTPTAEAPAVTQFVTLKNKKSQGSSAPPQTQVESINIDQLRVSAPMLAAPLDLSAFSIRLKSNSPRVIEMTAKTHLIRDNQVGDYLSHASVWAEYTEFPKTHLVGRLNGNWREGSYQLNANYFLKEDELTSDLDLKHVPLSQVAQVLKKFNWLKADLSARQVWVSANAQMSGKPSQLKNAQIQLKDLRLEGDLGDVRVDSAKVTALDPFTYAPFHVDIERLNVEKWLALLQRPHPSPALGALGTFSGEAEINGPDKMDIVGFHKGLEFIFSNKGQREVQTLKEIRTEMHLASNRWELEASNAVVDQGALNGKVLVTADRSWQNVDIDGKVPELRLSPNVIRLMTAGGQVGALSADVRVKIRDGNLNSLKGTLNSEGLTVEGVSLTKSRWQLDSLKADIVADGQVQQAVLTVGSPAFRVLKDVIEPEWMNDGQLEIRNLNTQLQFNKLKRLTWKNLSAQLQKNVRLASDGGWDENGLLDGQLQWSNGKASRRWSLGGQRDHPAFVLNDSAKKKKQ